MKNPYIQIANRKIDPDYPPLVIAELGINHEGSLKVAKEMTDAAHRAGVEVIHCGRRNERRGKKSNSGQCNRFHI